MAATMTRGQIDLRPAGYSRRGIRLQLNYSTALVGGVILVALLMGAVYTLNNMEINSLNVDIQKVDKDIRKLQELERKVREAQRRRDQINDRIAVINQLEGLQIEWARVLNELVWALPSEVKIDRIQTIRTADAGGTSLIVDGSGSSINRIIGGFMANLERSDLFEAVNLRSDIKATGRQRFPFSIEILLAEDSARARGGRG
ncbi:MAG: PilN domain-containing protein [Candidatus Bipolaricaulia bacterium]